MRSFRPICVLVLLPFFTLFALLPGCQEEVKGKKRPYNDAGEVDVAKVAVVPGSYGTVTGKITYDGTPPTPAPIQMGNNEAVCHQGAPPEETKDESWLVSGPNGGVKNVAIILQPPDGKYFQIPDSQLKEKDVTIEQPRCAFIPRVFTFFCSIWNPTTNSYGPSPNKLIIHNNAAFDHNFNMLAGQENQGRNFTMRRDSTNVLTGLVPESKALTMKCDIHAWMRCYGFMLDHPYAAVTKADGTFNIDNAPLGVDVHVVCWHEAAGFFGEGGQKGFKMTLKDNDVLPLPKVKAGR